MVNRQNFNTDYLIVNCNILYILLDKLTVLLKPLSTNTLINVLPLIFGFLYEFVYTIRIIKKDFVYYYIIIVFSIKHHILRSYFNYK